MARAAEPEVGQRFRPVGRGMFGTAPSAWEVIQVFTGIDGLPYVRLHKSDDPTQSKTMSLAVLADPRRFRRVA